MPSCGYTQLKGHYICLQKCYGPWPRIPLFKSCRDLYGTHFHNNGQIFEELLSLHINLCQEVVIYNQRAIILAFQNSMAHGPEYLGSKAVGPYMEPHFHNNGQIFE